MLDVVVIKPAAMLECDLRVMAEISIYNKIQYYHMDSDNLWTTLNEFLVLFWSLKASNLIHLHANNLLLGSLKGRKKVIWVWNDMRVNKWPEFSFFRRLNHSFNLQAEKQSKRDMKRVFVLICGFPAALLYNSISGLSLALGICWNSSSVVAVWKIWVWKSFPHFSLYRNNSRLSEQ